MPKILETTILQYICHMPQKKGDVKFIFLHADKHQTFLQVDAINFDGHDQPNYPEMFAISLKNARLEKVKTGSPLLRFICYYYF